MADPIVLRLIPKAWQRKLKLEGLHNLDECAEYADHDSKLRVTRFSVAPRSGKVRAQGNDDSSMERAYTEELSAAGDVALARPVAHEISPGRHVVRFEGLTRNHYCLPCFVDQSGVWVPRQDLPESHNEPAAALAVSVEHDTSQPCSCFNGGGTAAFTNTGLGPCTLPAPGPGESGWTVLGGWSGDWTGSCSPEDPDWCAEDWEQGWAGHIWITVWCQKYPLPNGRCAYRFKLGIKYIGGQWDGEWCQNMPATCCSEDEQDPQYMVCSEYSGCFDLSATPELCCAPYGQYAVPCAWPGNGCSVLLTLSAVT